MKLAAAVALLALVVPSAIHAACTTAPREGCRQPVVPHKSPFAFKQTGRTDPDDIYTWIWQAGEGTSVEDFGSPLTTTDYVLCLYDQSDRAQPVVANEALAATGWKAQKAGYSRVYNPSRPLRRLVLHAGGDGKARILAHGDSDTVRQILPFVPPVVVQLQANTGACWETVITDPTKNDAGRFAGKD